METFKFALLGVFACLASLTNVFAQKGLVVIWSWGLEAKRKQEKRRVRRKDERKIQKKRAKKKRKVKRRKQKGGARGEEDGQ